MTKKAVSVPTLISIFHPDGSERAIRPELIALVDLGDTPQVVLTDMQTAFNVSLESAEFVARTLQESCPPLVLLGRKPGV